jgi:hypothetical protein
VFTFQRNNPQTALQTSLHLRYHPFIKTLAKNIISQVPEFAEKVLETLGFGKKKFKNGIIFLYLDDEESKFMASFREKMEEDISAKILEGLSVPKDEEIKIRVIDHQRHRFVHGADYINKLDRIKGYKDVEIEGKRIIAKFSLKVKMDKCKFGLIQS